MHILTVPEQWKENKNEEERENVKSSKKKEQLCK